jgi:hypothetical protein
MKTIFKSVLTKDFTTLPNETLRDSRLTFKARGLLAMVLSNVNEWVVTAEWLESQADEGRDAIRGALKELKRFGYAKFQRFSDNGTKKFTGCRWTFYDFPHTEHADGGKPSSDKPSDGKASCGKIKEIDKDDSISQQKPYDGFTSDGKASNKEILSEEELLKEKQLKEFVETKSKSKYFDLIPISLRQPDFLIAWNEWLEDRKERRKPVTFKAAKIQLPKLALMGEKRAIAAIENSIEKGYQGIFEATQQGKFKKQDDINAVDF